MKTTDEGVVETVLGYYQANGRHDMQWRQPEADGSYNAYKILVSEIMLQQTQVSRVAEKYRAFVETFPTARDLAQASFPEVVALWVGLGYNRRAKYLHEAVRALAEVPEPWSYDVLVAQKGIGPNTAAAILTYAYDAPYVFIETNIRTVIIHHYFSDAEVVSDKEVADVLQRLNEVALARATPRQWYWALMDYGSYLKAVHGNASRKSKSYKVQSKFNGSNRQLRGQIIRLLSAGPQPYDEVERLVNDDRFEDIVHLLTRDRMVKLSHNTLMLYNE